MTEQYEEQLQIMSDKHQTQKRIERDNDSNAHDSKEDRAIKEKEYPINCELCGRGLYMEVNGLTYEEREKFGCGYKCIRINEKYVCPHCLVHILWKDGHMNLSLTKEDTMEKEMVVREPIVMPQVTTQKAVEAFNAYQELAKEICTKDDIQKIGDKDFKKKSFWRKCQRFFNLSLEKLEERREDINGKFVYHFLYRAIAPNGAFCDGAGSCSSDEKGLLKTEHIARATAETRAKNRAISDLVAFGEVSYEEVSADNGNAVPAKATNPAKATKTDIEKRGELYQLLIQINNGDKTQSELERILEEITAFTGKDGNEIKGVRSLKDLKGKRLDVTIIKAKKIVEENTPPEE